MGMKNELLLTEKQGIAVAALQTIRSGKDLESAAIARKALKDMSRAGLPAAPVDLVQCDGTRQGTKDSPNFACWEKTEWLMGSVPEGWSEQETDHGVRRFCRSCSAARGIR